MEKGTELVTMKRLTPKPSPDDKSACSILADQVSYEKKQMQHYVIFHCNSQNSEDVATDTQILRSTYIIVSQ